VLLCSRDPLTHPVRQRQRNLVSRRANCRAQQILQSFFAKFLSARIQRFSDPIPTASAAAASTATALAVRQDRHACEMTTPGIMH
jgi:hypothetical protein